MTGTAVVLKTYHSSRQHKFPSIPFKKEQCVQTSVACFNLSQLPATALLSDLHWLYVKSRIRFKLAYLTYKLLSTDQPDYLPMLLHYCTHICTRHSANELFLNIP